MSEGAHVEHLGGGNYIASGSMEDLWALEVANQAAALAKLTTEQRELLDGRAFCWFRWQAAYNLAIFGECKSVADQQAETRATYGDEDDFDYAEGRRRGFAFGTAYSVGEARGELGDTHLLDLVPVSRGTFEAARTAGWDMNALFQQDLDAYLECSHAWNRMVLAIQKKENADG